MAPEDWLYLRHPPLVGRERYEFEIPEHKHLEDQSVNSELINQPGGEPRDVLYDTKNGNHHFNWEIAKLSVHEVEGLTIPNEKAVIRKGEEPPAFTFEVVHDPTPCMYPHCVILARKDKQPVKNVSAGVKTAIRARFAAIADGYREEMLKLFTVGADRDENDPHPIP